MHEDRKQQKENILAFFQSDKGLKKLKKAGAMVEDDFGQVLPIEKIIKNIGYNKLSVQDFEKAFGKKWVQNNWSAVLEIMFAYAEPDCLKVTIEDTEGNKIMAAYVNSFQIFGNFEYKQAICYTIAQSVFRTLINLPTEREFIKALSEDDKRIVDGVKEQFDYFKGDQRNDVVLNLIEKNAPKLRQLIKDKTGY